MRTKRGASLVELVVAIGLVAVIVAGACAVLVFLWSTSDRGGSVADQQAGAALGAYSIELAIRGGGWAYTEGGADSPLVVEDPPEGWRKRILLQGTDLVVETDGSPETIAGGIQALNFRPFLDRVDYELVATRATKPYPMVSSKVLRNAVHRGFWRFSEGSGDIAYDDSPANNNAAVVGAEWVSGPAGPALAFDGLDDYVYTPDNDDLDSGGKVAYGALVRVGEAATPRTIINRGTQAPDAGFFWVYVQGGRISYSFSTGAVVTVSSETLGWAPNTWYEVGVQHDAAAREVRFLRDGAVVGRSGYAGAMLPVTSGTTYVGSYQGTDAFWRGELDEVRFLSFE